MKSTKKKGKKTLTKRNETTGRRRLTISLEEINIQKMTEAGSKVRKKILPSNRRTRHYNIIDLLQNK